MAIALPALFDLMNSSLLRNRTAAACWNEAELIVREAESVTNHAERLAWARLALPDRGNGPAVREVFPAVVVLIQDDGEAATDAQVQGAVHTVVDKFAVAGV